MKDFLKNYVSWRFDTKYTIKQQLRRLHELEKNVTFLFKKMYSPFIRREMWHKIVDKNLKLTIEYIDLINCLYEKRYIDESLNCIEEKMRKIKKESGFCLKCFDRENEDICICVPCDLCGRVELCFC